MPCLAVTSNLFSAISCSFGHYFSLTSLSYHVSHSLPLVSYITSLSPLSRLSLASCHLASYLPLASFSSLDSRFFGHYLSLASFSYHVSRSLPLVSRSRLLYRLSLASLSPLSLFRISLASCFLPLVIFALYLLPLASCLLPLASCLSHLAISPLVSCLLPLTSYHLAPRLLPSRLCSLSLSLSLSSMIYDLTSSYLCSMVDDIEGLDDDAVAIPIHRNLTLLSTENEKFEVLLLFLPSRPIHLLHALPLHTRCTR
jgi:hypothetical protein